MTQTTVRSVDAWEVLDSRGNPTVACRVELADGSAGQAAAPSGASTGQFEAHELRDGEERYAGKGVLRAVTNVRTDLAEAIQGLDAADQRGIDDALRAADGTPNLSRLGANAVLAVSLATALAGAAGRGIPLWRTFTADPLLPRPMINIISGGAHAGRAIDVQDFLAVPLRAKSFAHALELVWRVRAATAEAAAGAGLAASLVADEGGIAGPLPSSRAALDLLVAGIERAGLRPGDDIGIAIDVAANQLRAAADGRPGDGSSSTYRLAAEGRTLSTAHLSDLLLGWLRDYPVVSIEDPLHDEDWAGWIGFTAAVRDLPGHAPQVVGDDLFATNLERVRRGIAESAASAVLVKVNQNGTVTGAHDVTEVARGSGFATVVSARSGETEDHWLADLAVGWRAGQIKVGSTHRSERTAKWNRLLQIEHELAGRGHYAEWPG